MRLHVRVAAVLAFVANAAGADSFYSAGGWATLHRTPENDRAVPISIGDVQYDTWTALEGATVLVAPTTSPDGQTLYIATGRSAGNSNLHAYSLGGEHLWSAEPWRSSEEGVDPCAVLSSAIVDAHGDLYLGDCNQLWAFRPDGEVKWVTPFPAPQEGDWKAAGDHPVNAFTTAIFTREGHVAGVTNFGDVVVFGRESGEVLNAPFRLPGAIPPASDAQPMPDGMFGDGLLDPAIREWSWQLIFGGRMRSANTPAVSREDRIFVVGSGAEPGLGALYALDLESREGRLLVRQAYATPIGLGSGSSPALSPDQATVYVSDEEGWLYAIDAASGEIRWKLKTWATAAAAAVGRDGMIYVLQANAPALAAVTPEGSLKWESDLSALGETMPSSFLLGDPVVVGNGNPTVVDDAVMLGVSYGYEMWIGRTVVLPVRSAVVAIDLETGMGIRDVVALPDGSEGITAVLGDGAILSSLGAAMTSAISPLAPLANWLLPGDLEVMQPRGGVQIANPRSAKR